MSNETRAQKVPSHTVRIGKGQFEILRHLNREKEVKYEDLVVRLIVVGAYTSKQWAQHNVDLFITTKIIDRKDDGDLRLTQVGRKLLDVIELLLKEQHS